MTMDYAAITHDGQQYRFPASALPLVEAAMANKTPVRIAGSVVSGSSISHVDSLGKGRYGPENTSQLSLDAGDVFALEDGMAASPPSFWKEVLNLNRTRKPGQPWYYAQAVEWGMRESGLSDPQGIFDFLASEPELAGDRNRPDLRQLDNRKWVRDESARFLATEDGMKYRSMVRGMDLDRAVSGAGSR